MLIKKNQFAPNPKIIKKMRNIAITKQKLLFFTLCSDADRSMITGEKEMDAANFERISCLIRCLGLYDFEIAFEIEHKELLKQVADKIEYNVEHNTVPIEYEQLEYDTWLNDFIHQLPTDKMQKYIHCIFDM